MKVWDEEKLKFLVDNYPKFGAQFCADKLGFTKRRVVNKVGDIGLKMTRAGRSLVADKTSRPKDPSQCNINHERITSLDTKECCYFLGLMWADGYIGQGRSYHRNNHFIRLELKSSDFVSIEPTVDTLGKWNKVFRCRDGKSPSSAIVTYNKVFHEFLRANNYGDKHRGTKLIHKIPEELLKYWYRGYLDGDGSIYVKGGIVQLGFSGPYEQDWDFVEELSRRLEVSSFGIQRFIRKNGNRHSAFRITNVADVKRVLDFIYDDYDEIGFPRKHKKYEQVLSIYREMTCG